MTENQLFRVFCQWEGIDWRTAGVVVIYPKRFELRDRKADLDFLNKALTIAERIGSATLRRELKRHWRRWCLSVTTFWRWWERVKIIGLYWRYVKALKSGVNFLVVCLVV